MEEELKIVLGKKEEKKKTNFKPNRKKTKKETETEQFKFKKSKLKIIPLRRIIRNW